MIRTQVYLPDNLHLELRLLAKTEGVNYSSLVRDGIREIIRKKRNRRGKKPWREFIGALKYGPQDLSNHINDIYK